MKPRNATVACFVQARMGSTRLPEKMITKIGEFVILEWVLKRLQKAENISVLALLTSSLQKDNVLTQIADRNSVKYFTGSESDVASRFVEASKIWPADHYIRICADNPFICYREIETLIDYHIDGKYDYSFNHIPALGNNYADGFGAEIFSNTAMQSLGACELTIAEKEHVTKFFWNRREQYKFGIPQARGLLRRPDLVFDVDTPADLAKFKKVEHLIKIDMNGEQIVSTLEQANMLSLFLHS
ncbi:MAG: cytidyltransferase [Proteobacteria bacterium]|nr:cytidyltransferase [Pseudomonadota bacterium]